MNKIIKKVALFTLLSIAATGCQKEEIIHNCPVASITEASTAYTMQYTIDGVIHSQRIHNKKEYSLFIHKMLALAEEGHNVTFFNEDKVSQNASTKEVHYYSTKDKNEAYNWAHSMSEAGYFVSVTYDEHTNTYNCVAYR